ncbi:MAG: dephospho-CoA kinase [Gammaproteobacteria bacterium]|nr:MAG: dephospho-CoA kinase [Gammaproteobacteria bacterium]
MSGNQQRRLRIGLTGGIASGKSLVAEQFARLGVTVIDTDRIAREIVAPGTPALAEITAAFGSEILTPDGGLDRRALRATVFADSTQRRRLEAILHPRIRQRTLQRADADAGRYHVIAVPLLIETDFQTLVDRVLVVDCPESAQRERLLERDDEDPQQIERILAAQASRQTRLAGADDVIDNSGSRAATCEQVAHLHEHYLELAAAR